MVKPKNGSDESVEMGKLVTAVRGLVKDRDRLVEEIESVVEEINRRRDAAAVEIAKQKYSVEPGVFVRYGGGWREKAGVVQVLSVWANRLYEGSFGDRKIEKTELEIKVYATCARLHKGTGKPIESRRKWGRTEGEPNYETVEVELTKEVVIVPADEVVPKRQKAEKSAVLKVLSKLSPKELEELVKKAKIQV